MIYFESEVKVEVIWVKAIQAIEMQLLFHPWDVINILASLNHFIELYS